MTNPNVAFKKKDPTSGRVLLRCTGECGWSYDMPALFIDISKYPTYCYKCKGYTITVDPGAVSAPGSRIV